MSDVAGKAVELVASNVLTGHLREHAAKLKDELAAELPVGVRWPAVLGSGVHVGTVTFKQGNTTAGVVDERALLAWVRENRPDEIIEQVRPSYLAAVLDQAKRRGAAVTGDGEVIPGIAVRQGDPYLSVLPTKEPAALAELVDVMRAGQLLALDAVPPTDDEGE